MNRGEFLKILGVGSLITMTGLPSFVEVEKEIVKRDGIEIGDKDPFAVIRKMMKERALPDWEYHFRMTKEISRWDLKTERTNYTVYLLQNGNHHAETYFEDREKVFVFNERRQRDMFDSLIYGVNQFNAQPEQKRKEIIEMMDNAIKQRHVKWER